MKKLLILITLIFANNAHTGFEPPVIIDPPNPQEGDIIRVGIFEEFYPPCLLLPRENSIGETHSFDFNNNNITLNILSDNLFVCNPIPFSPAPREYYELGTLDIGTYTLTTYSIGVSGIPVNFIPPFTSPNSLPADQFGTQVQFSVRPRPQTVNFISPESLLIAFILFLILTNLFYRKYHEK